MVRSLIFLLSVLISANSFAALNPSAPVSSQLGSVGTVNASLVGYETPNGLTIDAANSLGWFSLNCGANSITAGRFYPCLRDGAIYRVASGKTAECHNIVFFTNVSGHAQLVSSLTAFAAGDSSITSGTYQGGAAGEYRLFVNSAGYFFSLGGVYTFAALSYTGMQATNASNQAVVYMVCRER